jgi:hypothetical protein
VRFGDPAREVLDFRVSGGPSNLAREYFDLFSQGWIGTFDQFVFLDGIKRISKGLCRSLILTYPNTTRTRPAGEAKGGC